MDLNIKGLIGKQNKRDKYRNSDAYLKGDRWREWRIVIVQEDRDIQWKQKEGYRQFWIELAELDESLFLNAKLFVQKEKKF